MAISGSCNVLEMLREQYMIAVAPGRKYVVFVLPHFVPTKEKHFPSTLRY